MPSPRPQSWDLAKFLKTGRECRPLLEAQRVVEGEEQILADVPHHSTAERYRFDNSNQVTFHECDACALHCYVCAGSHRDPYIGFSKGWCVRRLPSQRRTFLGVVV